MAELRIPVPLLIDALADKSIKELRLLLTAKILHNSRANIRDLIEAMDIHPKTGSRLIKSIVSKCWAGTDGTYLFPRAWHRIKTFKRGGMYTSDTSILADLNRFEALAFAFSLMKLYRRKGPGARNRSAMPKDLSLRYTAKAMGIKDRRCKTLRSLAQKYGFITIKRTFSKLGTWADHDQIRRNIHGPPVYRMGELSITPGVSIIKFHPDKFCP